MPHNKKSNPSAELRAYAVGLQLIQEEERAKIAKEMHDTLAQDLIALNFQLAWLSRQVEKNEPLNAELIRPRVEDMATLVEKSIKAARSISTQLHPGVLDSLGLQAALEWSAEDFTRKSGVACILKTELLPVVCQNSKMARLVFKLFMELLKFVEQFSTQSSVRASILSNSKEVTVMMEENEVTEGEGDIFNSQDPLNLFEINALASVMNGKITVGASSPGSSAKISIVLPIPGA